VDDDLLAELAPDDCAAIRAAQDDVVRTPLDRLLIVRGGPGTGKTLTALRRVAWLIDEGLDDADALVVGPSPAFARYTDDLLRGWGYDGVVHHPVHELLPAVGGVRDEAAHVTRLKGEARMAGLLSRALAGYRGRVPSDLPATISVDGREVKLDQVALQRVITTALASEAPAGDRLRILRAVLAAGSEDPRLVLEAADLVAEQLWPPFEPTGFLRDLFGSRTMLEAAAGGEFTDREIDALYRLAAEDPAFEVWSEADLPLLDEADHLVNGDPKGYAHVVVDEAQDLSPMELRAVCRRAAAGSMTIVGDIAQSTGPWARDDWHDLVAQLPVTLPHEHRELSYGYRVPRQIFELAAELLPMAAPSVEAPTPVRLGPADPVIVPAGTADRARLVVGAAAQHEAAGRAVAVICPARWRDEIEALLDDENVPWRPAGDEFGPGIVLVGPHEAKGLEFDAAVVVEPGHILDDDPRGHRLLYVALTRATGHLHLVGAAEDLPMDFGMLPPVAEAPPAPPLPAPEPELGPGVTDNIDMVVQSLAETLLANLSPELWPIALRRLEQLITPT
jgi:DNA helicase IV